MSWSLNLIGSPVNVMEAIEERSRQLDGESKIEFDAAMPHLTGLIGQNFTDEGRVNAKQRPISLVAYGSGASIGGVPVCRSCSVELTFADERPV